MELDSHADTIVCGSNCLVLHYTGKECDVSPYTDAYEAIKSVPIVQAATAHDNLETGETHILILNEAIWMGDQKEVLVCHLNRGAARYAVVGQGIQENSFRAILKTIGLADK